MSLFRFKGIQFCESCFEKVQFFESFFGMGLFFFSKKKTILDSYKKELNSLSHMVEKKKFNSLSPMQKRFNSFSQIQKRCSTLWVTYVKNSALWVVLIKEEFNSSRVKSNSYGREVQFLEHFEKKSSILWVVLENKKGSILRVILKKKKDFNSLSHIEKRFIKRGSILWVLYKEFHSLSLFFFFFDTRLNSLSHISGSNVSILCVTWKKKVFISLRHIQRKEFNSLRQMKEKGVHFFASYSQKKDSILCVSLKEKRVQLFASYSKKKVQLFAYLKKDWNLWLIFKNSILWVTIFWNEPNVLTIFQPKKFKFWVTFKKGFDSLSQVQKKKVQVFEQFFSKVQYKNKSSTLIEKRFIKEAQLNESFTKSSIIWVIVTFKEGSILWVIVEKKTKRVQFFKSFSRQDQSLMWVKKFEKKKNSLGHFQKNGFNFYEYWWKKGSISMSHVEKSVQFCELYTKKGFNSENEIQKNQFLESSLKKLGSLSHISKRRFNSVSRITKKFNSLSHFLKPFFQKHSLSLCFCKKKVQFSESYFLDTTRWPDDHTCQVSNSQNQWLDAPRSNREGQTLKEN